MGVGVGVGVVGRGGGGEGRIRWTDARRWFDGGRCEVRGWRWRVVWAWSGVVAEATEGVVGRMRGGGSTVGVGR